MKKYLLLLLCAWASNAFAQWSNTTNNFEDSLHMPVSVFLQTQKNPIVLTSYPDGGYFVIWEDERNMATTKTDIYAQKYDQAGNRLWSLNGVPVANGSNDQRFAPSTSQDYRNRSYAATDSSGGFFICYTDDSTTNYSNLRIAVQHMRNDGTAVFSGPGYILAQTAGTGSTYSLPLLIADGNKGFFVSFIKDGSYVYAFDYEEINGSLHSYGGANMNQNAVQRSQISQCGIQTIVIYPGTSVIDYNIWPDGQGGCNVIMSINGNIGEQYKMLCFNKLWRAKRTSHVKTYFRNTSGTACPKTTDYTSGMVYPLYYLITDQSTVACGGSGGPVYVVTSERLLQNGYELIDHEGYDYNFPKGVTVFTSGNINVDLMAVTTRTLSGNNVSPFIVKALSRRVEKYDSIPYQRASYANPDFGYNGFAPVSLNKVNFYADTILASSSYYPDFSLTAGGKDAYAVSLMSTVGDRQVRLQHLAVERQSPDSFAIVLKTSSNNGEVIGKEIGTGFSGFNISYDLPFVRVSNSGTALFTVREYYRSARVSPVINGTQLAWGAMGVPIGAGYYNGSYYNFEQPVFSFGTNDNSGVIAWKDNRYVPPTDNGDNIQMRHIDFITQPGYTVPGYPVKLVPNPYGASPANPAVLAGVSKAWSTILILSSVTGTSPLVSILDNYDLGRIQLSVYQNSGVIRRNNNQPYLDRNFSIVPEKQPVNATIPIRLFFTTQEFDALKAADNSLVDPGGLVVIKQPYENPSAPAVYTPDPREQIVKPTSWAAVPGGYYVELPVNGFSSFFLMVPYTIALCKNGNSTINTNLTGATYQWQLDTGAGFANIQNNANYSGTGTASLSLINMPTTTYGYKFRCLVNGTPGNVFTLKFTANWTGLVNSAWETPGNWSCNTVPDINTDVYLNTGPVVVNSNVACRSLLVNKTVNLTVNTGKVLTVVK